MASTISWLDASTEEQRRNREILGLFRDRESREELGLGQIRDTLGDGLFPGSSTLHTRARYFFFIPWIFQAVTTAGGTPTDVRLHEEQLIAALQKVTGPDAGVIGARAGSELITTPSSMYWSALGTYGILLNPGLSREKAISPPMEGWSEEFSGTAGSTEQVWRPSIPAAPNTFPDGVSEGMDLTRGEAEWLRERIVDTNPQSLYAHLLNTPPRSKSSMPWEDPAVLEVTGPARTLLKHARYFSETFHGAQLLYNLLIAESYEEAGFDMHEGACEEYREKLEAWAANRTAAPHVADWSLDDFFHHLKGIRGTPLGQATTIFVRRWVGIVRDLAPHKIVDDKDARELIRNRETWNKGKMARIDNSKRLKAWGGISGAGQYSFRWPTVRRIVEDIHRGLSSGDVGGAIA